MLDVDTRAEVMEEVPVCLPHEWVHAMWEHGMVDNLGKPDEARQFWQHVKHVAPAEWALNFPWPDDAIPLGLHGDGAAYGKWGKLLALSWNGMLSEAKKSPERLGTIETFAVIMCQCCVRCFLLCPAALH